MLSNKVVKSIKRYLKIETSTNLLRNMEVKVILMPDVSFNSSVT